MSERSDETLTTAKAQMVKRISPEQMDSWNEKPSGDWEASPMPRKTQTQLADVLIFVVGLSCVVGLMNWAGFIPQPTIQIQVQAQR